MTEGAILGNYQFTAYRSDNGTPTEVERMTLLAPQKAQLRHSAKVFAAALATAEATVLVRDLCNHPSNVMTPTRIANEAKKVAKEEALNLKILEQKDMEQLGMGALLGVARGSHEPPKFIILEYNGAKKKRRAPGRLYREDDYVRHGRDLAQARREHGAHEGGHDRWGRSPCRGQGGSSPQVAHASGQHSAGGGKYAGRTCDEAGGYREDAVGKTVEVQNTDAEGRLILADALAYAQRYNPAALVDIATLTGACVVALGQFAIGMFGTDDKLKAQVRKSGQPAANGSGKCRSGMSISNNCAATSPTCATSADAAAA